MNTRPRLLPPLVALATALAAVVLAARTAAAQEAATIPADRPGFTDGPFLVQPGHRVVESGYSYARAGTQRDHAIGELLLRAGLRRALELRVDLSSYQMSAGPGGRAAGLGDASLGAKLRLADGGDAPSLRPAAALLVGASVPTGARATGRGPSEPRATLAAAWNLPASAQLTVNAAGTRRGPGAARRDEWLGGVVLSQSYAHGLGGYVEYTSRWTGEAGGPAQYLNAGATLLRAGILQLDGWAAVGLHRGAPDHAVGLGIARQW